MSGFPWPDGCRGAASFTFDVDAESGVLCSHPAAAGNLSTMSHQAYGPRVGLPRILAMLDRHSVRATFFVPGYTAECYPDRIRMVRDAGHEVAAHGYLHETPADVSPSVERAALLHGLDVLEELLGTRPIGYRSPSWGLSLDSVGILGEAGIGYDSSLMDGDEPYLIAHAAGRPLVELPVQWGLDDWEPFAYLPEITGSGVIAHPREVVSRWTDEYQATTDEGGHFILTCHPFLSGRPSRTRALEELVATAVADPGVWVATMGEVADLAADCGLVPREDLFSRPEPRALA
ncbi:polysaccharide deacetylase family protein [Nocardioides sp. LHG3406-4]|uniref:polysaccharide deacetylase family protein n=1 Tax=Nocardioides sp. LHG3406-4 TaxID=2804575 RepID=UPI003CE82741